MRDHSSESVYRYCEEHSSPPSALLRRIERTTFLSTVTPQMISGPYQGKLIEIFSRMIRPKYVLEVGTFTGYSTICLSAGLEAGGHIDTIEADPEREHAILQNIREAGLEHSVVVHIGDALTRIPKLEYTYDMIFVDAGKRDYKVYYELLLRKLRQGGVMLFDNMLWGGKVARISKDQDTHSIDALNKAIVNDERVNVVLLPVRDGLSIIIKN